MASTALAWIWCQSTGLVVTWEAWHARYCPTQCVLLREGVWADSPQPTSNFKSPLMLNDWDSLLIALLVDYDDLGVCGLSRTVKVLLFIQYHKLNTTAISCMLKFVHVCHHQLVAINIQRHMSLTQCNDPCYYGNDNQHNQVQKLGEKQWLS